MPSTTAAPTDGVLVLLTPGSPILTAELARLLDDVAPEPTVEVVVVLRGADQLTTYASSLAGREVRIIETPTTDAAEARRLGEVFVGAAARCFDGDGIRLTAVVTPAPPGRLRALVQPLVTVVRRVRIERTPPRTAVQLASPVVPDAGGDREPAAACG